MRKNWKRINKSDRMWKYVESNISENFDKALDLVMLEPDPVLLRMKLDIIGELIERIPDPSERSQKNGAIRRVLLGKLANKI